MNRTYFQPLLGKHICGTGGFFQKKGEVGKKSFVIVLRVFSLPFLLWSRTKGESEQIVEELPTFYFPWKTNPLNPRTKSKYSC